MRSKKRIKPNQKLLLRWYFIFRFCCLGTQQNYIMMAWWLDRKLDIASMTSMYAWVASFIYISFNLFRFCRLFRFCSGYWELTNKRRIGNSPYFHIIQFHRSLKLHYTTSQIHICVLSRKGLYFVWFLCLSIKTKSESIKMVYEDGKKDCYRFCIHHKMKKIETNFLVSVSSVWLVLTT